MSVSPASADFKARVAKLQLCDCKRNWPDPHLTIELDHIPVQRGEATAISYVWGEFDRRDVPIGHPPGKSEDIIRMNLGIEWVTQDVIHRLAEIAADKPIWMDQLCIPQNDEEIRRILANIATIYKTFDVAVLMPGHPCACLSLIVKELEARAAEEGKGRIPNLDDDIESYTPNFCLNVCPLSSWMSRLWTFQELGFSQSARCVWVSKDVAKCVFSRDMPSNISEPEGLRLAKSLAETDLQPYATMWFRRTVSLYLENGMEEQGAVRNAWSYLQQLSFGSLAQIHMEVKGFDEPVVEKYWITRIGAFNDLTLYKFLSGEVIQRAEDRVLGSNTGVKLLNRILLLQRHFAGLRRATHARDYVIAIFAEVDGYSPPPNYKNKEFPMLLQHAIDWHRRENNNVGMLSTAPQGLFMPDAAESFLWRPAYYLSSDRIRTVNDLYQTLLDVVMIKKAGTCDVIPLSYCFVGCIALSAVAKRWEYLCGDFAGPDSVPDIAVQLKNTMRGWARLGRDLIVLTLHEEIARYDYGQSVPNDILRLQCLCVCLLEEKDVIKDYISGHFSMADLYLAFYELVCRALCLDVAFCLEKGVKLMFSPPTEYRQYTRVGLCRRDVKLGGEQAHGSDHIMAHQSLTVSFQDVKSKYVNSKDVQFEAERIDDHEGKPAYRVFGVWVRMEDKFEDDIGAVYDHKNPLIDAFLL